MKTRRYFVCALALALISGGCVAAEAPPRQQGGDTRRQESIEARKITPQESERLYRVMTPLLKNMDHPKSPKEVSIGIIDQAEINAANAGGGEFYITSGLLKRANDEQLRGVLAHEIAHEDLGHVAKLQVLGAGLNIGIVLLEQLIPGSSAVTPIAGSLIARGYSRNEEFAADRHGVQILQRAGYSKDVMINALEWVTRVSGGGGGGGFLSTHPATEDRISELAKLR
jgi:predicted Zn-dependent protease